MNIRLALILTVGIVGRSLAQSPPVITQEPAGQMALVGANVNLTAAVFGVGPFSFQWQLDDENLATVNDITVFAGAGGSGFSGDGGPAASARLSSPNGLAYDALGNLFIADTDNNRIREVGTNGVITTVAGNGIAAYAGDGGAATNASLSEPASVVFDGQGNLFMADSSNNCVRKVDGTGTITTVAGNGTAGYTGDGSAATNASLASPSGLAFDGQGNLFIADSSNNCIRKVDGTGTITTVAGNGTAGYSGDGGSAGSATLNGPSALAMDFSGNLYIADAGNNRVRVIGTNGVITTFAGDGTAGYTIDNDYATNVNLSNPTGLAVNVAGTVFIADTNEFVLAVNPSGIITAFAGDGAAGSAGVGGDATLAELNHPQGLAVDGNGNVFISDSASGDINKVTVQGPTLALSNLSAGRVGNYDLVVSNPFGSVTSSVASVSVLVPPTMTNQIIAVGSDAAYKFTVEGSGPFGYQWYLSGSELPGQTSAEIFATMTGSYVVVVTNASGAVTSAPISLLVVVPSPTPTLSSNNAYRWTTIAGSTNTAPGVANGTNYKASFDFPSNLILDTNGNIYLTDRANSAIRKITPQGTNWVTTTIAGLGGASGTANGTNTTARFNSPSGLAMDTNGTLYVADRGNSTIRKITPQGTNWVTTTIAGLAGTQGTADGTNLTARFADPQGPGIDSASNLYIADYASSEIRKISPSGTNWITTTLSKTNFVSPGGVAISAAGTIFVDNQGADTIETLTLVGTKWVATNLVGTLGETGLVDGTNKSALFDFPGGLAVDSSTNIYVADSDNNAIRKVTPMGTNWVVTTIGGGVQGYKDGPTTAAEFNGPNGVAVDPSGNVYVADGNNNTIRMGQMVVPEFTIVPGGVTNFTVMAGSSVIFNMAISGKSIVQWQFDGTNLSTSLSSGSLHQTLLLTNVTAASAGQYVALVPGASGAPSSLFLLTVLSPPVITQQPASQSAAFGANVAFSVSETGTQPLSYQWYAGGAALPGQTNSVLEVTDVGLANAVSYQVVISNNFGSVTSSNAVLTVGYPPTITSEPAGQNTPKGSNAVFAVGVTGTGPFSYQWQFNGTNIPSVISTVAGNGTYDYTGDGGAATNAGLAYPSGVALDASGNLYIAEYLNMVVRKVAPNGIISTIAGNGTNGFAGDDGAATNAELDSPYGLAVDGSGDVFIADAENNRIREVGTNGIITTIAGTGTNAYGGDGGLAVDAGLNYPISVAVDAFGNVFIADEFDNRIRMIGTNGIITTVAGNGSSGFGGDGGAATSAKLSSPQSIAVDGFGNLFIADSGNYRIREVGTNGVIMTVAGNGSYGFAGDGGAATSAKLSSPQGIAVDGFGNLFIADTDNYRIREVGTSGSITTVAGRGTAGYSGDGGRATNASLYLPSCLLLDGVGNCIFSDTENNRVRKFNVQDPSLIVSGAGLLNVGNYDVVVASPFGSVTSSVAVLNLAVPTVNNQSLVDIGGAPLPVVLSGTDPSGLTLSFTVLSSPAHGALSGTAPNLVYTPNAGFLGSDSFTFAAADSLTNSAAGTISIAVEALPVAVTLPAGAVTINTAVLAASVNPNNQDTTVWFAWGLTTNYGNVTGDEGIGTGSAALSVADILGGLAFGTTYHYQIVASNAAGVAFGADEMFTTSNHAPVAVPDSATIYAGQTVAIPVLANDEAQQGDVLTVISVTAPAHGQATFTATNVTYANNGSSATNDSFSYTLRDSFGLTASAVVTISIAPPVVAVANMNDTGAGSLRAAVELANSTVAGVKWSIHFNASLAGQTVSLANADDQSFGPSALIVSNAITLDGTGAPGLALSLDAAAPPMRLIHVTPTGSLTMSNLTLQNGVALGGNGGNGSGGGGGGAGFGGAIYNEGNLTLDNVTLTNNQAVGGNGGNWAATSPGAGGIPSGSGNPSDAPGFGGGDAGSTACGGSAGTGGGGAIFNNNGVVALNGCTVVNNSARGGQGGTGEAGCGGSSALGLGGGLFNLSGSGTVSNSLFLNDNASFGGAICAFGDAPSSLVLYQTTLTNAGATDDLYSEATDGSLSTITEVNSAVDTQNSPWIGAIPPVGTVVLGNVISVSLPVHLPNPSTGYLVTAASSNPTLVPSANLTVVQNSTNWTLNIQPVTNQFGITTITVTASNGTLASTATFTATVGLYFGSIVQDGADRVLNFTSEPGLTISVQSATNLASGSWTTLGAAVEAPIGTYQFRDVAPVDSVRFYRLETQ